MDEENLCRLLTKLKVAWDFDCEDDFDCSILQNLIRHCPPKLRKIDLVINFSPDNLPEVPRAALDFTSLRELEEITVPGGWCLGPSPLELDQRLPRSLRSLYLMYCECNKFTEEQIASEALKRKWPKLVINVEMMDKNPQILMID
jgi:hypothetical protein